MTSQAGRGRVLACDPIGPVASDETFEAPAIGGPVLFRILVHDTYHIPITFGDYVSIMHCLKQVEDDHGSVGKCRLLVTFQGLVVVIEIVNAPKALYRG